MAFHYIIVELFINFLRKINVFLKNVFFFSVKKKKVIQFNVTMDSLTEVTIYLEKNSFIIEEKHRF